MKCPNCASREFDVYEARGFTSKESPIKECGCGHVWRLVPIDEDNKRIDIIKQGEGITESDSRLIVLATQKKNSQ